MTVLSLLNPLGWFGGYRAKLSGGQAGAAGFADESYAGQPVTAETALSLSTYWACVKIIAQTIGTLPLELYRLAPDGSRTPQLDDPLYDLLHDQPNADHTAVEFWEGVGACLAVWGNSYALKHRIGKRLVALELLRPFWMMPARTVTGDVVYRYTDPWTGLHEYGPEEIFHVRGFGFGDLVGLSPLVFNRHSIGTALAVDEAAGRLFRNGLRVTGWYRYKGAQGILKPEQRQDALRALSEGYVGSQNAGKAGVLPGDFDWIGTAMNPADAEMLNNRKLNVEEICRAFGVPPVMVGHIGQGQTMWGTGVEHIVLAFMTTGLRPYLHRIEAAIGRDIIGRADRRTLRASFNVEELLRGDNKGSADVDQSLANTGIMTRNEIRARRGLPPKPGGDTLTVQSALIPIDKLGELAKLPKDKAVEPGADIGLGQPQQAGGGPKGQGPFDETKAWNPDQPRDALGRFVSGSTAAKVETIAADFLAPGVTLDIGTNTAARSLQDFNAIFHRPPAQLRRALLAKVPGVDAERSTIQVTDIGDGIHAEFQIDIVLKDAAGRRVGEMERRFKAIGGKVDVKHALFELESARQAGGIGKSILKNSLSEYRTMGASQVKLTANIDVGGYAWAKYGFTPTARGWENLRSPILKRFETVKSSLTRQQQGAVLKLLTSDDPRSIFKLADLRASVTDPAGRKQKLGKMLLLGTAWNGSLDPNDGTAMARFKRYVDK